MLQFSLWLENTEEVQVAHFLEDIIDKAVNLFKQDMQAGSARPFLDYVKQIWPPEANHHKLTFPDNLPAPVAGQPVEFKRLETSNRAQCWHQDGKFLGFIINIEPFFKAKSIQQVDQYAEALKSAIHHECEHIKNPGSDYQGNGVGPAVQYMSNPGEIQAHAREMARAYAKHFPNQPFDINKAKQLLSLPNFNTTHRNYFDKLADPNISKQHGLQQNPYDLVIQAVKQLLPQYQG